MKKSLMIIVSLIFSVISLNANAGTQNNNTLNPSVLMILDAGIQADSLFAERMISLDIQDELKSYQLLTENNLVIHGPMQIAMNKTANLEFTRFSVVSGLVSDAD